jgi:hypothetical protein
MRPSRLSKSRPRFDRETARCGADTGLRNLPMAADADRTLLLGLLAL